MALEAFKVGVEPTPSKLQCDDLPWIMADIKLIGIMCVKPEADL